MVLAACFKAFFRQMGHICPPYGRQILLLLRLSLHISAVVRRVIPPKGLLHMEHKVFDGILPL